MKEQISVLRSANDLCYPDHAFISPYTEAINQLTAEWINEYGCLNEDVKKKTGMAFYGTLTAEILPRVTMKVLIPVCRWMLWAFIYDDYFGPFPKPELRKVLTKTLGILRGDQVEEKEDGIFKQLQIAREELKQISTPEWMERFIASHRYYFTGLMMDTYSYQKVINYPSSETYLQIRNRLIGGYMVCDLLELSAGSIFPLELVHHPGIQRIRVLASQLMIWDNDIFSYKKELAEDEAMNMVLILMNEHHISVEEAVEKTIEIRESDYMELLDFQYHCGQFGKYSGQVEIYLGNLLILLKGQLDWYKVKSRRYH